MAAVNCLDSPGGGDESDVDVAPAASATLRTETPMQVAKRTVVLAVAVDSVVWDRKEAWLVRRRTPTRQRAARCLMIWPRLFDFIFMGGYQFQLKLDGRSMPIEEEFQFSSETKARVFPTDKSTRCVTVINEMRPV